MRGNVTYATAALAACVDAAGKRISAFVRLPSRTRIFRALQSNTSEQKSRPVPASPPVGGNAPSVVRTRSAVSVRAGTVTE